MDWLDELCKEGRAAQTENKGGYPDVYQTQVRHVFPWLLDGKISPQDDAPNGNFTPVFMEDDKGKTVLMKSYGYRSLKLHRPELLHALPLEAVLTIQVFDLS
ncbi:hypothetical protein [Neisseria subflava]|uniref:hypothetical protein n=1 Tax=Neisseria subflava TaxID=28449 RepID=UPI0027DED597|nr:hypothetical protein [Neisseria subflava]